MPETNQNWIQQYREIRGSRPTDQLGERDELREGEKIYVASEDQAPDSVTVKEDDDGLFYLVAEISENL